MNHHVQGHYTTRLEFGQPDDGDQGRQMRGLAIALLEKNIRADANGYGYKVPSQSGKGVYFVSLEHEGYCSCPDFEERNRWCKHIYAVHALQQADGRLDDPEPEPVGVRVTTPRAPYNDAQVHEGEVFATLLRELCDTIPQPPKGRGRPRLPIGDMIFSMATKVYANRSTRRAMSDIRGAVAAGRMCKEPAFTTPITYFGRPELTPVLEELIQRSALPLKDVEVDFAQDSSGFASTAYHRWFDEKWGKGSQKAVKWTKLHIMCGVQSNIVTVAAATPTQSADAIYMPDFVRITAENFRIREVSGDAAYSTHKNIHAVADVGGTAYIPFRTGATATPKGKSRPDPLWAQMYHLFTLNEAEFNRHYHKRSNVETCFHMMKAKFGDKVRAKTATAQVNEVLLKVLCHNLVVLIHAMYALGITPVFDQASCAATAVEQEVVLR